MYVTIKLTPQRVMIIFIVIALWYCFIGTTGPQHTDNNDYNLFSSPSFLDIPSVNKKLQIKLTNHKQRILTAPDTNNNSTLPLINMYTNDNADTSKALFHIKYPPIPSIVGIGPEKCGTTSMAYMLSRHSEKIPELVKPVHEPTGIDSEMRVWLPCGNTNFEASLKNVLADGAPTRGRNYCSLGWYQHFWTPQHDDIRYLHYYTNYMNASQNYIDILTQNDNKIINGSDPLTWHWKYYYYFEKSPAYWCYEHVAYLFNKLMVPQGTKFFILMRDPIRRTFSYWSHQTTLGHLHGKWVQFITNSLQNTHIQTMITLLKDESKNILEIKDDLLAQWKAYTYANDKPYGYIGKRDGMDRAKKGGFRHKHIQRRKLLWSQKDPGYVKADTNPKLGLGASCYVIPLLMWLKYVPSAQLTVMQSELMYGGNHNNFISDVRCWYSVGYEYDTLEECKKEKKKNVEVSEEHLTVSSKGKIEDNDARRLHNELFQFCNQRLKELLEMDEYKHLPLHQIEWDAWYS